jgi:hypothetical protein
MWKYTSKDKTWQYKALSRGKQLAKRSIGTGQTNQTNGNLYTLNIAEG